MKKRIFIDICVHFVKGEHVAKKNLISVFDKVAGLATNYRAVIEDNILSFFEMHFIKKDILDSRNMRWNDIYQTILKLLDPNCCTSRQKVSKMRLLHNIQQFIVFK